MSNEFQLTLKSNVAVGMDKSVNWNHGTGIMFPLGVGGMAGVNLLNENGKGLHLSGEFLSKYIPGNDYNLENLLQTQLRAGYYEKYGETNNSYLVYLGAGAFNFDRIIDKPANSPFGKPSTREISDWGYRAEIGIDFNLQIHGPLFCTFGAFMAFNSSESLGLGNFQFEWVGYDLGLSLFF